MPGLPVFDVVRIELLPVSAYMSSCAIRLGSSCCGHSSHMTRRIIHMSICSGRGQYFAAWFSLAVAPWHLRTCVILCLFLLLSGHYATASRPRTWKGMSQWLVPLLCIFFF
eukprot:3977830-Pyramimonas_sp.AAC.1